jgi:hypothetical protein
MSAASASMYDAGNVMSLPSSARTGKAPASVPAQLFPATNNVVAIETVRKSRRFIARVILFSGYHLFGISSLELGFPDVVDSHRLCPSLHHAANRSLARIPDTQRRFAPQAAILERGPVLPRPLDRQNRLGD